MILILEQLLSEIETWTWAGLTGSARPITASPSAEVPASFTAKTRMNENTLRIGSPEIENVEVFESEIRVWTAPFEPESEYLMIKFEIGDPFESGVCHFSITEVVLTSIEVTFLTGLGAKAVQRFASLDPVF